MATLARTSMFLLAILVGLLIGAGVYEALVIVPTWTSDPQAAFRFWAANPGYATHAGSHWWIFMTPITFLVSIVAAICAGRLPRPQSRLVRTGALVFAGTTVVTFVYFVPAIIALQSESVLALSAEAAKSKASLWVALNWVRAVLLIAAWLLVIKGVASTAAPVPTDTTAAS